AHQLLCACLLVAAAGNSPSPPSKKTTGCHYEAGKASTCDGARRQEAPDLTARKHSRMDVEIGLSGHQSPKQSRLGARGSTTVSSDRPGCMPTSSSDPELEKNLRR